MSWKQFSIDPIQDDELLQPTKFEKWFSNELNEKMGVIIKVLNASRIVEVVLCKDCIHNGTKGCPFGEEFGNPAFIRWEDDYCSWGERKEE